MSRTWIHSLAVLAIATVLCAGTAMAQLPDDTYFVSYFSNAHSGPDATVRIDNPGVSSTAAHPNLCADIYVFDAVEEQVECCGCILTPDDLRTISVNNGLTDQPSSGVKPTNGVIKIVSALPNKTVKGTPVCDPTGGDTLFSTPNNIVPTPDIRAWATHIQAYPNGVTEEEFSDSTLTQSELNTLQHTCAGLQALGSGRGICSCGFGS